MYLAENLIEKWAPVLNHESLPEIKDHYKRTLTAVLLENQEKAIREQRSAEQGFLVENTSTGSNLAGAQGAGTGQAGFSGGADASPVAGYDPIMISLVRRAAPQLIAYDVCGVQPMTGPTGLIFAMKSNYTQQGGDEALWDEARTSHSSAGTSGGATGGAGGAFAGCSGFTGTVTAGSQGNTGETGGNGGEWGESGSNTSNTGDGGDPGKAITPTGFTVTGTVNSSTIKGSY